MWSQLLVPLLFISTVRGASPEFGPFTTEQMDQMRKNFKAAGECLHYCGGGTDLTLCEDFCGYELGFAAMGCQSLHDECKWTDDQGKNFAPGSCKCADDLEIATLIADIVFEGLSHLDEVICAVMFEAISLTVQIGLAAIPGPGVAISSGMRAGINAAKTIAENGMDAAQFTNWYSPVCGNGPIVEDISKTFDIWSAVPDEVVPGNGCVKKNKKCKNKGDDKGDDKKTDSPKTTKAATSTTAKATTTTTSSTFTTKYSDVPRPTLAFDACDLPDSDCYGSFDDFEGLEDNPLIYGEGSLEDGRLPTNPSPINQTDPSTNQTAPWTNLTRRFALEKRDRKYDVNLGGALGTLQIESLGYPGPQDLFEDGKGKKLTAHAYDFKSKNVDDYAVKDAYVKPGKAHTWAVEHVIEVSSFPPPFPQYLPHIS